MGRFESGGELCTQMCTLLEFGSEWSGARAAAISGKGGPAVVICHRTAVVARHARRIGRVFCGSGHNIHCTPEM